MNIANYKRLTRYINTNMAFLAFLPAMAVVLNLLKPHISFAAFIPLFAVVTLQFFFREYIKNFFLFLVLNLLCFSAGIFFMDNLFVGVVYMVFILLSVIATFVLRLTPREDVRIKPLVVYYLAVPAICEVLINKVNMSYLHIPVVLCAILYLLLYFVCRYVSDYTDFLHEVRDAKHVPFSQIRRSTFIMLAGFFAVALTLVIVSTFVPAGAIAWAGLSALGRGFLFLMRLIFGNGQKTEEPVTEDIVPNNMNPDLSGLAGDAATSMFWIVLEKIFIYGTVILIAVAIIAGIVYAAYNIIRQFNANTHDDTDVVEFLNPFDKTESVKILKKARRSILDIIAPPNEAKIRKIFYKAANAEKAGIGIGKHEENKDVKTPSELLPDNDILVGLYEKARYSGKACSKEDVAAAKKSVDYR